MNPDDQLRDEEGKIIFGTDGEPMTVKEHGEEYERWERDNAPEDYWRHRATKWEKLHDARTAELAALRAQLAEKDKQLANLRLLADANALSSNEAVKELAARPRGASGDPWGWELDDVDFLVSVK